MAVRIPIVTDFDGKGIARARREFAQLEGAAAKTKYALSKMAMPAAAAFTALAGATGLAVKASLEDQASQEQLARTIRATTGATDRQIETNSEWIDSLSKASGFVDDDIRPSFARLVRATKDVTKSQHLMALAVDVARGTGQDLNSVSEAFSRALGGNLKSLRKLAPELGQLIKDGATTDEVFSALAGTFGGDAAAYAETAAGKFEVFSVRVGELKEAFGSKLLPFLTDRVIPALERLVTWAEENPDLFSKLAGGIAVFTGSIVLMNAAMAASPWVMFVAGLGALTVALGGPKGMIDDMRESWESFQRALNGDAPGTTGILGGLNERIREARTRANIEGTVPENFDPAARGAQYGRRGPERMNFPPRGGAGSTTINVTVTSANPAEVVRALQSYVRTVGPVPIRVRNP